MITSVCLLVTAAVPSFSQISTVVPKVFKHGSPIELQGPDRVEISHNSAEVIREEILDTNMFALITTSAGLSREELASVVIAPGPVKPELWCYQIGESEKAWTTLGEKIHSYVQGRLSGHTKAFLLRVLTNHSQSVAISDADLRSLLSQRPDLPGNLLERADSGFFTNHVDDVFRRVTYFLRDDEIAWRYDFCLTRTGIAFNISEMKVDAKDFDPAFLTIIKEVEKAVGAEMEKKATAGRFDWTEAFWHTKKESLKAKGIQWRFPMELNPGLKF